MLMKNIQHLDNPCQNRTHKPQTKITEQTYQHFFFFLQGENKMRLSFKIQLDFHLNRKTSPT